MRKKVLVTILTATLLISGCVSANVNADTNTKTKKDETLVLVEHTETYSVYADKDTGVMYLWKTGFYEGGLTVMLNADGTPKIWQQEK